MLSTDVALTNLRQKCPLPVCTQCPMDAATPGQLSFPQHMLCCLHCAQAEGSEGLVGADEEFLRAAWPRLEVWYKWYNITQRGPLPGSFRCAAS
jgi:hypothetical protein